MSRSIIGVIFAILLVSGAAARAQDALVPPGGEPGCVALTRAFWVDIFEKKQAELSYKYLDETYIQHSEDMPTGVDWVAFWKGAFSNPATGPGKYLSDAQRDRVTRIVSIVGDEKFALLEALDTGTWDVGPSKGKRFKLHYYDLFRCENGKLTEHWYVPYEPPRSGHDASPTKASKAQ
jgi:predicted SnoaL-like aldol condensation-catalyzing enzyme